VPSAVIDTCVMIDMLMPTRERHAEAMKLRLELARLNVTARLPMFAIFEINHATRQEDRRAHGLLSSSPANTDGAPGIPIEFVPIDEPFVKKYFDVNLPEMRAGDLIFAALAKGDALPLITEDVLLATAAKSAGIRVLSTIEYRQELERVEQIKGVRPLSLTPMGIRKRMESLGSATPPLATALL
jgi:predicted nucleic acid-binding protein